jgi:DNA-binding transcriptional LysR family regulator
MRTDLRSLEWLVAVAEQGSIGAAARVLGVRQPSVTDRLQRLERHLHLALLQRSPRGTRLTPEGAAVVDWARGILDASDRLEAGVAALRRSRDSQLRVSASMTISEYLMPRWLADLRLRAPEVGVALHMCNSEQVVHHVVDGDADLGFVEGPRVGAGLATRTVATDELVVVVAPDHAWAARRQAVEVAELAQAQLVVREHGSGTRDTFDRALARAGGSQAVTPRLELGSTAAIKAAVLTGQGAGVLSRLATVDDVAGGKLVAVPVAGIDLRRRLRMVWRAGRRLSDAAAQLAACAAPPGGTEQGQALRSTPPYS